MPLPRKHHQVPLRPYSATQPPDWEPMDNKATSDLLLGIRSQHMVMGFMKESNKGMNRRVLADEVARLQATRAV